MQVVLGDEHVPEDFILAPQVAQVRAGIAASAGITRTVGDNTTGS